MSSLMEALSFDVCTIARIPPFASHASLASCQLAEFGQETTAKPAVESAGDAKANPKNAMFGQGECSAARPAGAKQTSGVALWGVG